MTTTSPLTTGERLINWARGSLPLQAAVAFLLATGTELLDTMVVEDHHRPDLAWLDVFDVADDEWAERTGGMSGGQKATWDLVRSMAAGELEDRFWRLDSRRKAAFLNALAVNHA